MRTQSLFALDHVILVTIAVDLQLLELIDRLLEGLGDEHGQTDLALVEDDVLGIGVAGA